MTCNPFSNSILISTYSRMCWDSLTDPPPGIYWTWTNADLQSHLTAIFVLNLVIHYFGTKFGPLWAMNLWQNSRFDTQAVLRTAPQLSMIPIAHRHLDKWCGQHSKQKYKSRPWQNHRCATQLCLWICRKDLSPNSTVSASSDILWTHWTISSMITAVRIEITGSEEASMQNMHEISREIAPCARGPTQLFLSTSAVRRKQKFEPWRTVCTSGILIIPELFEFCPINFRIFPPIIWMFTVTAVSHAYATQLASASISALQSETIAVSKLQSQDVSI